MPYTFPRKGYGRIFVEKAEDIPKVKEIIRQMDEYEYEYLPEKLIAVFEPKVETFMDNSKHLWLDKAYTHKFDSLNLNEFQYRCWAAGIKVFCCVGGGTDYECYDIWEDNHGEVLRSL